MAMSIGLQLTREEALDLFFCAFSQVEFWGEFLDQRVGIAQADVVLFEQGLPRWATTKRNNSSFMNKSKTTIKMAVLLLSFTKPFILFLVVLRWT